MSGKPELAWECSLCGQTLPATTELEKALTRVRAIAPAEIDQVAIVLMGTQAWASGITPDQMDTYARISASRPVSAEDLRRLEQHGINTKPEEKE